jgi:hypothetical protein
VEAGFAAPVEFIRNVEALIFHVLEQAMTLFGGVGPFDMIHVHGILSFRLL